MKEQEQWLRCIKGLNQKVRLSMRFTYLQGSVIYEVPSSTSHHKVPLPMRFALHKARLLQCSLSTEFRSLQGSPRAP